MQLLSVTYYSFVGFGFNRYAYCMYTWLSLQQKDHPTMCRRRRKISSLINMDKIFVSNCKTMIYDITTICHLFLLDIIGYLCYFCKSLTFKTIKL
jgi:hypothetical protein